MRPKRTAGFLATATRARLGPSFRINFRPQRRRATRFGGGRLHAGGGKTTEAAQDCSAEQIEGFGLAGGGLYAPLKRRISARRALFGRAQAHFRRQKRRQSPYCRQSPQDGLAAVPGPSPSSACAAKLSLRFPVPEIFLIRERSGLSGRLCTSSIAGSGEPMALAHGADVPPLRSDRHLDRKRVIGFIAIDFAGLIGDVPGAIAASASLAGVVSTADDWPWAGARLLCLAQAAS